MGEVERRFRSIEGLVDALAEALGPPSLHALQELGIIHAVEPAAPERSLHTAIQRTSTRLGVASWALNPVYVECRRLLRDPDERLHVRVSTAMLFVCPDFVTAWNVRKNLFRRKHLTLRDELQFCALVLTREPKSAETWAHRSWLVRQVGHQAVDLPAELRLAWMAASRASSNYYATLHRIRLVHALTTTSLCAELHASRVWLQTHIADSSGWAYHRALLDALSKQDDASPSLVDEDVWFDKMHVRYEESHQNIGVHRRWLDGQGKRRSE